VGSAGNAGKICNRGEICVGARSSCDGVPKSNDSIRGHAGEVYLVPIFHCIGISHVDNYLAPRAAEGVQSALRKHHRGVDCQSGSSENVLLCEGDKGVKFSRRAREPIPTHIAFRFRGGSSSKQHSNPNACGSCLAVAGLSQRQGFDPATNFVKRLAHSGLNPRGQRGLNDDCHIHAVGTQSKSRVHALSSGPSASRVCAAFALHRQGIACVVAANC